MRRIYFFLKFDLLLQYHRYGLSFVSSFGREKSTLPKGAQANFA